MSLGLVPRSTPPSDPFLVDEQQRIRALLARVSVFQDLPAGTIEDVSRRVGVRRVPGGNAIVKQEEPGDALHILMNGRAKVVLVADNGREVTLSVLRTGDIFGEMSLFEQRPRSASVVALDPVTVLSLSREDLYRVLSAHPQVAMSLLAEMSRRLRRASETIAELALCDVHDRLVRRLIALAREDGTENADGVLIRRRPTQQDLANMVGACRETISRTFNQLARRGLIVPRGRSLLVTKRLVQTLEAQAA